MMNKCLFPGSFDPFTLGHMRLVERALNLFDEVTVLILINANNGKKLLVLEARELLLMKIMKFVRRSVLESDYVMQERKQQQRRV